MKNVNQIIKSHNSKVANAAHEQPKKKNCNCQKKNECPLRGKCQVDNVIYKATVNSTGGQETYIGLASGDLKKRYYNHTKSFRNQDNINETELAKHVWGLKQ